MRKAIHKARFERQSPIDDFVDSEQTWELLCRAYVELEPLRGVELFQAAQVQSQATIRARTVYTPDVAAVTTADRFKLPKAEPIRPEEPDDDANYRVFHIESIINVRERNRTLEMMVVEKT